jgi:ParB/RepB/Spo0J family partition protein
MPTHPVASQLLPVNQIHPNPDQPRKLFDPEPMADLKESIDKEGLINAISVMQRGDKDYLIMAGERRFRACCELGWKEIDTRIWPAGTPPSEIELISLVENLQRTDLTALEVANGYKVLTQSPHNMTQEELGRKLGKTKANVNQYIAIADMKPEVQEKLNRFNFGLAHLLQICRLETPEDQIEMAQKTDKDGWAVKKLKAEVDKRVGNGVSRRGGHGGPPAISSKSQFGQAQGPAPTVPIPDPLSEVWSEAHNDEYIRRCGEWATAYGTRSQLTIPPSQIAPSTKGWLFWVEEEYKTPKQILAQWFGVMAERLGYNPSKKESVNGTSVPAGSANCWNAEKALQWARDTDHNSLSLVQKLADVWKPKNPEEEKEMLAQGINPWLPNTPEEWAEAGKWVKDGAAIFLQVILGLDTYWTRKCRGLTWQDLGVTDPLAGAHRVIEALRAGLDISKSQKAPAQ